MSHLDAVVVGAGMSGLVCAELLHRRGLRVLLLESQDHTGGRTASTELSGIPVDLGGQFLGPGQDRMYALAAELGVPVFPTHTAGSNLLEPHSGRPRRFRGMAPRLSPLTLLDVARAQSRLDRLAATVDPDAPWDSPDLDDRTLASWIATTARTTGARAFLTLACRAIWACEPEEISLLHAAFYLRSAGGLTSVTTGAQQHRPDGGVHALTTALTARLNGRILLNTRVETVEDAGPHTVITATDGRTWQAAHAVLATPPELPMGSARKYVAVYPTPFWREAALSGSALSLRGPITMTVDTTPRAGTPGMLAAYVTGDAARTSPTRQAILTALTRLYGARAATPETLVEQDWTDSAYAAVLRPGDWTARGRTLRRQEPRIHRAGTESSPRWYGYIEGAVRAGEAAAAAVTP